MKARTVAIAVAALALAAVIVAGLRGGEPETDETRIRSLFADAALAAQEKRIGDVMEAVSERFSGEGLDKQGVKRFVAGMVLRGDWVAVTIAGISPPAIEGDLALADVDVVTARSGKGKALADLVPHEASAHRIRCRLAREEGGWRVVEASWAPISLGEALAGPPAP